MFFKKKEKKSDASLSDSESRTIQTIPDAFYGGQNPDVYGVKHLEQTEHKASLMKPIHLSRPSDSASPLFHSKKFIRISIASVSFVIIVGAITWYYIGQAQRQRARETNQRVAPSISSVPIVNTTATETLALTTSSPLIFSQTTNMPTAPSLGSAPIQFPSPTTLLASDLDNDSLTDLEEEVFLTDSGVWDTDTDGYYDGQEVINLYNPKGIAPEKLLDSGLVGAYVNPTWKYTVYYPSTWEIAPVDTEADEVLVSGLHGDFIEIRAIPKGLNESFVSWFATHAAGQQFSDYFPRKNRFGHDIFVRKDGLVIVVPGSDAVFVIVYHTEGQEIIFPHIIDMMTQSFQEGTINVFIPSSDVSIVTSSATSSVSDEEEIL